MFGLSLLFLMVACAAPQNASQVEADPVLDVPQEHVIYGKPQVQWIGDVLPAVVFGRPIIEPASEGRTMRVTQPVSTTSRASVILEYRFRFVDAQDNVVAAADPDWRLLMLSGGNPVFLEGRGADELAVNYLIELKARSATR